MIHRNETVGSDNLSRTPLVQAVLTHLADLLPGMDHQFPGVDGEVLRIALKFDEQHIAGFGCRNRNAQQARLHFQCRLQSAIARYARVACLVEIRKATGSGAMDDQASAIQPDSSDTALVAEWRINGCPGSGNDLFPERHFDTPTALTDEPSGTNSYPPKRPMFPCA